MKKVLFFILSLSLSISLSAQRFSSVTPSGHTLYYMITNSTTHEVSVCRNQTGTVNFIEYNLSGSLVIPDSVSYGGVKYAVTGTHCDSYNGGTVYNPVYVYCPVFNNQTQLTSVTFPSTMETIDRQCFQYCPNLTTVIFNSGLHSIGDNAFEGCISLSSVSLPSSVYHVGTNAFSGCSGLSTISLSSNINYWGANLFSNCTSLTSIVIPEGISAIGNSAFSGCRGLTNVVIEDSVINIASNAFLNCTGLMQISIPNSVTNIGSSAFSGCISLQNLDLPDSLPYISSSLCEGCFNLESVSIPNTIAYIQTNAFNGCSSLFSVTVPNSVLSIETNSFGGVFNVVYSGMATGAPWGAYAVNGFIQDSILYSDNTMTTLLRAHPHVTSVNIPTSVTTIGASAFQNCTNLSSLTIGSNVQSIGEYAFYGCTSISSLTIGNNVQVVGNYAFSNCAGLTNLTIGGSVLSIGQNAFQGCSGLTTLNYNASATCSFQGCTALTNVTLGSNVTAISNNMFDGCTSLTTSPLTNNIQTIGAYAFCNTSLSTIIIPQQCTYIGEMALPTVFTIVVRPINPPTLGNYAFGYPGNRVFYVPCDRLSVYQSAWTQYGNNMVEPTVDFDLNVQTSEGGQAYATSSINCQDSTATIQATSDYGYHFDHWSDGITDNPRTIHVTHDTTVTAIFARNSYTITLHSADMTMGSTTGGGTYLYGETATLMAVPVEHYHLLRWTTYHWGYEQTVDHQNPLSVVVTENMEYTAYFANDTYYVNVVPNEVTRGSVTGGGYAEYGSPITVTATPYSGYQFVRWSNGAEYNPYTFAVTSDMTLEAVFMEEGTVYHVEATSDNSVMGTVTGGGPYATGETAVLTAVAYPGYHFIRWQDNVTENPRSYLVTHDASFVAYFEPNVGIGEIEDDGVNVYVNGGRIIVENVNGMVVRVYDMMGRLVATASGETVSVPMPVGVYLVKVGTLPARKVVVIR